MKTIKGRMRPRLTGIGTAAEQLSGAYDRERVSTEHLRLVVLGDRRSDALLAEVREKFPALLAPGGLTWNEWMEATAETEVAHDQD